MKDLLEDTVDAAKTAFVIGTFIAMVCTPIIMLGIIAQMLLTILHIH